MISKPLRPLLYPTRALEKITVSNSAYGLEFGPFPASKYGPGTFVRSRDCLVHTRTFSKKCYFAFKLNHRPFVHSCTKCEHLFFNVVDDCCFIYDMLLLSQIPRYSTSGSRATLVVRPSVVITSLHVLLFLPFTFAGGSALTMT